MQAAHPEVMPGRVNRAAAGHRLVLISLLSSAINWPQLQTVSVSAICFFVRRWWARSQRGGLGAAGRGWQEASAALPRGRRAAGAATSPDSCAQLSGKINCEGTFKAAAREGSAFLPAVVAQGLCRENWSVKRRWAVLWVAFSFHWALLAVWSKSPSHKQTGTKTWILGMGEGIHLRLLFAVALQCSLRQ